MKNRSNGILALSVLGLFYIWRNRFQIQRYLQSQGINLPFNIASSGNVADTIRGGAAKVSGQIDNVNRKLERDDQVAS